MLQRGLFCREMREVLCVLLSVTIALVPVVGNSPLLSAETSSQSTEAKKPPPKHSWGKATVDDKPYIFNELIDSLSEYERIQLATSLQLFPKIKREDFGQFGLLTADQYAHRKEDVSQEKPLRPNTFNEVSPEVIKAAMNAGRLSRNDYISSQAIKNGLLWVAYSTLKYPFLKTENINYHEIVQWVAEKKGIDSDQVKTLPTFELERKILEKYFAEIWDKLTPEQRKDLLRRIEKETRSEIKNKAGIALMGGGAAIAALGATVAFTGFTFYTTMSVVIYTVAGWFGLTLPFSVYMGASSTVALLAGPIGWAIAASAVSVGVVWAAWPSVDRTASFVMQLHFIKAQRLKQEGLLK